MRNRDRLLPTLVALAALFALLAASAVAAPMTRIAVVVKDQAGKPVEHASIIVKFLEGRSVAKLGKHVKTAYEMRSNQEGEARVPSIPQGKILIQVIAKGFQTFGQTFDVDDDEKTIDIKLNPPQQQYSAH